LFDGDLEEVGDWACFPFCFGLFLGDCAAFFGDTLIPGIDLADQSRVDERMRCKQKKFLASPFP